MESLIQVALILFAFAIAAPLGKLTRVGSVLAFVGTGILIGPWGLKLVTNSEDILHFAEIGVVFLLFIIGLELQPKRLWALRKYIFLAGILQLGGTLAILFLLLSYLGYPWQQSLVISYGLSLSSTAFALRLLADKNELQTPHGKLAFGILLFQDLAVIPFLAMLPFLVTSDAVTIEESHLAGWQSALIFIAFLVAGRYLLIPFMRIIAWTRVQESFTAMALLLVIGSALLMEEIGLSMGLGAFMAGVLVADSEYRHQLEADIDPFKALLLGLFFLAVGMSTNVGVLLDQLVPVLVSVVVLLLVKIPVLFFLGKSYSLPSTNAARLGAFLSQGGEFGFVAFTLAAGYLILPADLKDMLILIVTISMALTPLMLMLASLLVKKEAGDDARHDDLMMDAEETNAIIIAGFGRFGQILGRILNAQNIHYTAIDINPEQVRLVREYGNKVYFGDARDKGLLETANIGDATILALCIDDMEASLAIAQMLAREYPRVKIYARARNRHYEILLRNAGVTDVVRETLLSGLGFTESVLLGLNFDAERVKEITETFRKHDGELLAQQTALVLDKTSLIQTAQEAAAELKSLLQYEKQEEKQEEKQQPKKDSLPGGEQDK